MIYKPSFASFLVSSLYGFTPAILAGVCTYFLADSTRLIMWIASGFMYVLSLFLFLQTVFVHLKKLYLDDNAIGVYGPFLRIAVRWQDVVSAVLRERENLMSRTDRLLVIKSGNHTVSYNFSTLSRKDENEVLELVKTKTHLVVKKNKSTI